MTNLNIINKRIKVIENTKKLTKAMELIAINKMNKILKFATSSQSYINAVYRILHNLKITNDIKYQNKYFTERHCDSIGYLIISSDQGLVGGLNTNLFKHAMINIEECKLKKIKPKLFVIGSKGILYFNKLKLNIIDYEKYIGNKLKLSQFTRIITVVFQLYENKIIDKLFTISNKFINNKKYVPVVSQILPIKKEKIKKSTENWDYIYEPESKIINIMLQLYVKTQIYDKIISNFICEQKSRILAMKSATENSSKLIQDLKLKYNKIRQHNITQEITEVISGTFNKSNF